MDFKLIAFGKTGINLVIISLLAANDQSDLEVAVCRLTAWNENGIVKGVFSKRGAALVLLALFTI